MKYHILGSLQGAKFFDKKTMRGRALCGRWGVQIANREKDADCKDCNRKYKTHGEQILELAMIRRANESFRKH